MGLLKVLGLQLCLLAFSIEAEARFKTSVSDTKDTNEEPASANQPLMFENGYEALYRAEAPEFGLEVKHQDPQDYDVMLMTHRVRRSERKKKRNRARVGAYAPLGSILTPGVKQAPDVVRAKRQLMNTGTRPKTRPKQGQFSVLGRQAPPTPTPTKSGKSQEMKQIDMEY